MMKMINADALILAFIERSKYTAYAPFSLKEIINIINNTHAVNDIDFPNSTKGSKGDSVTPINFTEFD